MYDKALGTVNERHQCIAEILENELKSNTVQLDECIKYIQTRLRQDPPPSDSELDDYLLKLSIVLYSTGVFQEQIGIKQDVAEMLRKEKYDILFMEAKGTVADKTSHARDLSKEEEVIAMLFKRAYKTVCNKQELGEKVLDSIKKVITRRMKEADLSRMVK